MNKTISIKNVLYVVAMFVFVVLAFAAVKAVNSFSDSVHNNSTRSFSVSAQESVVAIPDIAQFNFSVITEGGRNLAALQEENTRKTNEAIAFLKEQGIDAKDIKTENYSISPRYTTFRYLEESGKTLPPEISGYIVTQTVSVKVRDLAKAGELVGGVVEHGANFVGQLFFAVDDPSALENQARAKAIASAKAKAEILAAEGGFKLGKLLNITESGFMPYSTDFGRGGIQAEAAVPTIEAGSQEITASVTMQYEIK